MNIRRSLLAFALCAPLAALQSLATPLQDGRANTAAKQSEQPATRRVKGRTLISDKMPRVRIKLDKAFEYVGSQRFILYDVAEVEQFFFVVPDKEKGIRRLVIAQFEGYLPNNTHTYDYKLSQTVRLGAHDYMTDFSVGNAELARKHRPDSDIDRAVRFLESKGYRASGDFMSRRFVRLLDETRRTELLLLYIEEMSGTGFRLADFMEGGRATPAEKEKIAQGLLDRALKSFSVSDK